MGQSWNFGGEVASLTSVDGVVTLVEGSTFCISTRSGDVEPGSIQGLFFQDTRLVSRLELRLDGRSLEPLSAHVGDPFTATFVARDRPRPGRADSSLVVFRYRHVGQGMRESLVVRNFGDTEARFSIDVEVDADFAGLFDVKEGRGATIAGQRHLEATPDQLTIDYRNDEVYRRS